MKRPSNRHFTFFGASFFLFALCMPSSSFAAFQPDSLFAQGNRYYMKYRYEDAVKAYTSLIDSGYAGADLYYNLGNAYYKMNKLGYAILYYEKARLLAPGDDDIRQNLLLANAHIVDKVDSIPEFFLYRWIQIAVNFLSPNSWAILCLSLFVVLFIAFLIYFISRNIVTRKWGFTTGIIVLLLFILSFVFMQKRRNDIVNSNIAIILEPVVTAKSSPDNQGTNVFVLHEGTKVTITDSVESWKEIKIANGNSGWIQKDALGEI